MIINGCFFSRVGTQQKRPDPFLHEGSSNEKKGEACFILVILRYIILHKEQLIINFITIIITRIVMIVTFPVLAKPFLVFITMIILTIRTIFKTDSTTSRSHGLPALSHVWQHVKLSDALSWGPSAI